MNDYGCGVIIVHAFTGKKHEAVPLKLDLHLVVAFRNTG
jgi:hypothetical protein